MRHRILALALAAALAGCSSSSTGSSSSSGSSGSTGGSGSTSGSTGGSTGTAIVDSFDLLATSNDYQQGGQHVTSSTVSVSTREGTAMACDTQTGATGCLIEQCPFPLPPVAGPALSAGAVTVTGSHAVTISPLPDGGYEASQDLSRTLWSGGESIAVQAAGGAEVAAFSLSALAPSELTADQPPFSAGFSGHIDNTQPFDFTWSGASSGEVFLSLSTQTSSTFTNVVCHAPAGDHTLTVPAYELSFLSGSGSAVAALATDATAVQGSHQLSLRLESPMVKADATNAYAAVQFP